jgi:hypothetical protein
MITMTDTTFMLRGTHSPHIDYDARSIVVADHRARLIADARARRLADEARSHRRARRRPGWRWRPRWGLPAPARPAVSVTGASA